RCPLRLGATQLGVRPLRLWAHRHTPRAGHMYGHKSALVPSLTGTSRWPATASVAVTREPAARALRFYTPACGLWLGPPRPARPATAAAPLPVPGIRPLPALQARDPPI